MKRVYLDYAATTPVKPQVKEAMMPYFLEKFGNPSSFHSFGQESKAAIDKAREEVALFLKCKPTEIIFTSGGSESDNLALRGIFSGIAAENNFKPHIVTSCIEHHAVLHTCRDLEKNGLAEVTYLPVDRFGQVSLSDLKEAIKQNTVLVSIMYANNEIGTIQPIREIGKLIEKIRKAKTKSILKNHSQNQVQRFPLFHTDAVQAIGYLVSDVRYLHLDMLSLSAHKFGGPKGVGALYLKEGVELASEITGGGQEFGKRAGTENVPGIVGLGKALELLQKNSKAKIKRIAQLRDRLIDGILGKIPDTILTGHPQNRLPNSASFCFKFVEGESVMISLDLKGVAVSTGSACTSASLEPSHVLLACGLDHQTAAGSVRFSLGEETTKEEIDYVLKILPPIIKRLRKMSPFGNKNQKRNSG